MVRDITMFNYDVQEFGALSQIPFAWALIVAFWTVVALGFTVLTIAFQRVRFR
jgi:hypothetical protein